MGFKRPFDSEELQELPFKHPRQFDNNNKLTQFANTISHSYTHQNPHISVDVEGGFCKCQWDEAFETGGLNDERPPVDKDFETSAPLSLITSISSEEDVDTGPAAISPISPEYFDFDFPRRTLGPVEDAYSLLLDRSPRKQVQLGPNHQANVPSLGRHIKKDKFVQNCASDTNDIGYEEIMMGTCVIPMPDSDLSANDSGKVGAGRTDCSCLDGGSLRCVRQHVMEAWEKLRKSLGHEKFVKLGFYDMGEDVAYKWSEEEEEIFREVVYSNPASLGKNFWKHFSMVFPSRSKRELVSYYFNVFILQRRAVQNRSSILDSDSDDDEWHGSQQVYEVKASEEDEDSSAIESLAAQEGLSNHEGDCLGDDDDDGSDDDDDDDDDDSGDSDSGSGDGNYSSASARGDYGVNLMLKGPIAKSFDESRFDPVFEQTNKDLGQVEDFNVQDDSCMSFEFQPNMVDSHSLIDTKADLHDSQMKTDLSKCMQAKVDGSSDLVSHVYLLDTCDAKIWDARYPTTATEGIDLQPTCNIIEEIFGQDTWDNKMRNE
ncbi:hypothetical protein ES319_D02G147700v1 [Gossypium barbadense]|uniref:Myb-like domain-containing protein n=1 Tax=Gossypium barbadense TaxID=3634 RepID=A0A5J5SES2_GOSBA|nr:hypothetical protein ES319_D02G147700v1 [Gossypium barbadense]KAB2041429.1 hypothetical protein ES319_D02G147700v1 [Gossypium barbadense]